MYVCLNVPHNIQLYIYTLNSHYLARSVWIFGSYDSAEPRALYFYRHKSILLDLFLLEIICDLQLNLNLLRHSPMKGKDRLLLYHWANLAWLTHNLLFK
jgi:hypothetical protein